MKKISMIFLPAALLCVISACTIRPEQKNARTVSVTGTGEVKVENEKAEISLSVLTRSSDVVQASEENARKMEAVQKALIDSGISRNGIQTSGFHINQETSYVNGRTVLGQYAVSNRITVSVSPIEKTGEVINAAIKAGANRFDSVSFSAVKTEDAEKQARILALRDAGQKAATLVSTSGASLGNIISIREVSSHSGGALNNSVAFARSEGAATPVSGGITSVSVTVEAVYEIQ